MNQKSPTDAQLQKFFRENNSGQTRHPSHTSNFETPDSHAKDSVKTAVNERIRISIEHRSRIFVRLSDPTMSTLRLPHLERPQQCHLAPLLRQHHRERRPPPEDEVRLVVSPPLVRNLTEFFKSVLHCEVDAPDVSNPTGKNSFPARRTRSSLLSFRGPLLLSLLSFSAFLAVSPTERVLARTSEWAL